MTTDIKNPTVRKIRNRGWTPISYHSEGGVRYGWLIESKEVKRGRLKGKKLLYVRFPGSGAAQWLRPPDTHRVQELPI